MTDPFHKPQPAGKGATGNLTPPACSESSDPVARDYAALRSDAALVNFDSLSVFELCGPDAIDFLQGMISNDVKQIADGQGCFATILSPIGKLIADLTVLKFSREKFWLICRSELKEKTIDALKRFIVSDQVDITDLPDQAALGIIGPHSAERLDRVAESRPQKPYDHCCTLLNGQSGLVVRDTRYGVDGYQIWCARNQAAELAQRIEVKCEVVPVGLQAFEVLRIEAGVSLYGIDFDETNIPLEANLEQALNFQKGCYTGQEVISRVTYLGSVSKKLMGLVVEGDTVPRPPEAVLVHGQTAGYVTSATRSPALGRPIALAYIQKQFLKPGMEVELEVSRAKARVQPLPLVPPQ